jgi:hypothetical protein
MYKVFVGALAALLLFSSSQQIPYAAAAEPIAPQAQLLTPTDYKDCTPPHPKPAIDKNAPPNSTYLTTAMPPVRYRGDATITIEFLGLDDVNKYCASGSKKIMKPVCGYRFYGCQHGNKLYMPHPCVYPETNPYTRLLCHEIGHHNGWPGTHGD